MKASPSLLVLGLLASSIVWAPRARAEVVDRVVAVVDGDAILLSEVRRRAAPFLERAMSGSTEAGRMAAVELLYRQTLERMVVETLLIQAARRTQVRVTDAEVERAISNVRTQAGLSPAVFWQAVAQQGYTRAEYRADVQRQLLRLRVLNHRARGRVTIATSPGPARHRRPAGVSTGTAPPRREVQERRYQQLMEQVMEQAMQEQETLYVSELRRRASIDIRL